MGRYRDRQDLSGSIDNAEVRQRLIVGAIMIVQVAILFISLDTNWSIICTAPAGLRPQSVQLAWWFGLLHFMFLGLLLFALTSFIWPRLRLWYVVLLCLGLAVLPLQARLVEQGVLYCDS